jgi:hypothetical protein
MRNDLYTKVVLTVIAVLLAVIAFKPAANSQSVPAQGGFSGVQYIVSATGNTEFFDSRTGDIWKYTEEGQPNPFSSHVKLVQLGKPLEK